MASKTWFEVDKEGLRELQGGKPKSIIILELVANALDEDVKRITITHLYEKGMASISVMDDSPEGFRDLRDAYTLFRSCYKRPDATKRGRFNVGEKNVFAICDTAEIITTKGTIVFDKAGRHTKKAKSESGSIVKVAVRMTKKEYEDTVAFIEKIIAPDGIEIVSCEYGNLGLMTLTPRVPDHKIIAKLPTVALIDGAMRNTQRVTEIRLYKLKGEKGWLYEMGLPVVEIDCDYDINVNQRVPMGNDRDTVSEAYLKHLYAEVLNVVHNEITKENASKAWVRVATTDERASAEAMQSVITQRYGNKVVVATPTDPIANDEAIARGYRVIHGSELSPEEWANIREHELIQSSHEKFGGIGVGATFVAEETIDMVRVKTLAQKIAREMMSIDITVLFVESEGTVLAQYGNRTLTFNVSALGEDFFKERNFVSIMDLLLHELAHEYGHHTEMAYHQGMTRLASRLIDMALTSPSFFEEVWA